MAIHPVTFRGTPGKLFLCSLHLANLYATGSTFSGDPEDGALFAVDATVGEGRTDGHKACDACESSTVHVPKLDTSAADVLARARECLWPDGVTADGDDSEWHAGKVEELAAILRPT